MIIQNNDLFTSDTHFHHANVIQYCNRPFKDKNEMNEMLIKNWNSVVSPDTRVFHLGDFSFGGVTASADVISRLNGYKIIIKGNHDRGRTKLVSMGFQEALLNLDFEYEGMKGFMQHVPDRKNHHKYDLYLCGHVHIAWIKSGNIINVGCDVWDYTPQTLDFIIKNAQDRQNKLPVQLNVNSAWEERNDEIIQKMEEYHSGTAAREKSKLLQK